MNNQVLTSGSVLRGGTNRYRIEKILGQGSFGITYLATTTQLSKVKIEGSLGDFEQEVEVTVKVAIKEFFMKSINNRGMDGSTVEGMGGEMTQDYRRKFRKEAINLSHLKHPNIVQVREVFDANNTTYYVMQFINGQSLDKYIKERGCLAEEEAIDIIKQVAKPLQYMHEKKMLHLDLKPSNIMLDSNNKAYLIDFGLSKQYTEEGEPETSTTIGFGTPGYAPLEQAYYRQDGSFPATLDVYALGGTLFKMLTGKTPPKAEYVKNDGLPSKPDHISQSTWDVIVDAMRPQKNERIQSVAEFLAYIGSKPMNNKRTKEDKSSLDDEKTTVDKDKTSIHSDKNDKKRIPFHIYTTACLVIVAIIIVGYILLKGKNDNSSMTQKEEMVDNLPKEVNDLFFESGIGVCSYTGQVDNVGKPHGIGKAVFTDGRLYNGPFNHGILEGENAHFEDKNGDIFDGEFQSNSFRRGKYTIKKDGRYFDGYFVNGKPDKGNWFDKNGKQIQATNENTSKKPAKQSDNKPTIKQNTVQTGKTNIQTNNVPTTEPFAPDEGKENPSERGIYEVVDQMPEYPEGGMAGLWKYLSGAIRYPAVAAENGVQGRVTVQFVVNRDGSIVDAKVLRGVDPYLDKEALRVINGMPKWKPGMHHGKPVRVRYTVPVNFRLN